MTQRTLPTTPIRRLTLIALILVVARTLVQAVTVLTVGPDGTYANIQDAIVAAVVGQDTEVRVQGLEIYTENLSIPGTFTSGSLLLWGGWDDTFTVYDDDPEVTIIEGATRPDGRLGCHANTHR